MAKDNSKNTRYTKEFKASILKRLEPPTNETITSLSIEFNIPRTTLYQWVKSFRKSDNGEISTKATSRWTSEDKFHTVIETAALSEGEIAAYCRRKGIYVEDLKSWREQCLRANKSVHEDPEKLKTELKEDKQKIKALEKELTIKEKALAETAALLVLRKKAEAIWGDPEDE